MTNENNPNLTEMIREIHDGVAREMYCKGVDDFLTEICKMIVQSENNGNYRFYAVEIKQSIADLAEQLKANTISKGVTENDSKVRQSNKGLA